MNRTPQLSATWRARLVVALVVMGALVLATIVHGAANVHAWFEAQESLEHWRGRLADDGEGAADTGFESPARRIERLEAEAKASIERLLLSAFLLLFSGALFVLGARRLRSG